MKILGKKTEYRPAVSTHAQDWTDHLNRLASGTIKNGFCRIKQKDVKTEEGRGKDGMNINSEVFVVVIVSILVLWVAIPYSFVGIY